jgi:hypothetical protein
MKAILAVLLIIIALSFVGVRGNSIPIETAPAIEILSPQQVHMSLDINLGYSPCRIYQNSSIPLIIEVRVLETNVLNLYNPQIIAISYSLDSKENTTFFNFTVGQHFPADSGKEGKALRINSMLTNLAEGNHTLEAYSLDSNGKSMATETTFTVDTTYVTPKVNIISPKNNSINANSKLPFVFFINKDFKGIVLLDRNSSSRGTIIPITENTTLPSLSEGVHILEFSVTFYDKYHYGVQGATNYYTTFIVDTKTPNTQILSSQIIIATIGSIAASLIIFSFILVLFKNKKKQTVN